MMRDQRVRSAAVAAVLAVLLILTGCSSSDDPSSSNYVPVVPADNGSATDSPTDMSTTDTSTPTAEAGALAQDAVVIEGFDDATQAFDAFLRLRAQAITREIALEALEPVATAAAIAQVSQLRNDNDTLIANDSYAALTNLAEWSNVTSIVGGAGGERLEFTDCTERQFQTPGGATVVRFVTNRVEMVDDGGQLKVDNVIMVQDGIVTVDPETFGCAPPSFIERADEAARVAVETAAELIGDPAAALESELPPIFVDDARADLERVLQTLVDQGLSRTADETVTYDVLGIDVNRPEFTVVVAVCRTYPNGRFFVTTEGEQTVTDLPVGSSYGEWVYVNLEPVPSGTQTADRAVAVEDRGPNCQEG